MLACIYRAELELVGIGMLLGAEDARNDDIGKVGAGRTALLDFEAGHGKQVAQFLC
jgi:hypothetical protein